MTKIHKKTALMLALLLASTCTWSLAEPTATLPQSTGARTGNSTNNEAAPISSAESVNVTRSAPLNAPMVFGMVDAWSRRATIYSSTIDAPETLSGAVQGRRSVPWSPRKFAAAVRATSPVNAPLGKGPFEPFMSPDVTDDRLQYASSTTAMTALSAAMREQGASAGFYGALSSQRALGESGTEDWRRTDWNSRQTLTAAANWWLARPLDATVQAVRPFMALDLLGCTSEGCLMSSSHIYTSLAGGNAPDIDPAVSVTDDRVMVTGKEANERRATVIWNGYAAKLAGIWSSPTMGAAELQPADLPALTLSDDTPMRTIGGMQLVGSSANLNSGDFGVNYWRVASSMGVLGLATSPLSFGVAASTSPFAAAWDFHKRMETVIGWDAQDALMRSRVSNPSTAD